MNNSTNIIKRCKENLPLFKKLALVDVPNLYDLFNSLIDDFCKQKYKNILENNPYHTLDMYYGDDRNIGNIKYMVSLYEAARITGIWEASIRNCCIGKHQHAGGYIWKFPEVTFENSPQEVELKLVEK